MAVEDQGHFAGEGLSLGVKEVFGEVVEPTDKAGQKGAYGFMVFQGLFQNNGPG